MLFTFFLVVKHILSSLDELIQTVLLYSFVLPVVFVAASIKPVIIFVWLSSTVAPEDD